MYEKCDSVSRRAFLRQAGSAIGAAAWPRAVPSLADDTIPSSKTFVRTQQIAGVWWLINAAGERFVTLGVNHVDPAPWLAPYNREATLKRYGNDFVDENGQFNPKSEGARRWVARVLALMNEWHFNTIGMHGPPHPLFKAARYYVASIQGARLAPYLVRLGQDPLPDVFREDFRTRLERRVRELCCAHQNESNLLGYSYSDTPVWTVPHRFLEENPQWGIVHPWVEDLRRLPADAAGKQQWLQILRKNYPSATAAAMNYAVSATSWEGLAGEREWGKPRNDARAAQDSLAMLTAIAERWYSAHHELIRQHDPSHLILGDKLNNDIGKIPDWLMRILKRYVDVILIQDYRLYDQQKPDLIRLHQGTGKPIINGDSGFAVVKRPHQTHVKGHKVKSLKEVGEHYYAYLKGIMSLPFMLGWHHCGFMEQWDGAKRPGVGTNENGFLDPFEKPYEEALAGVIEANRNTARWHEAAVK